MRNGFTNLMLLPVLVTSGCIFPEMHSFTETHTYRHHCDSSEISTETPPGFEVSPQQAMRIFQSARGVRNKVQDIYYGDNRYFVIDDSTESPSFDAAPFGITIDGKTGQVFDHETAT